MPLVYALDVPEVLILIATHLAPADLSNACRVNRTWFVPFAAALYRTIKPDQFTDGGLLPGLPRYAAFIHELYCPRYLSLMDPGPELSRLSTFSLPDCNKENLDLYLNLLERNLGLQNVTIRCPNVRLLPRVVKTLARLKQLKSLSIESGWVPTVAIDYLLSSLPELKTLRFQEYENSRELDQSLATEFSAVVAAETSPPSSSSSSFPSDLSASGKNGVTTTNGLKRLQVVTIRVPHHLLLRLISSAPQLESLELDDTGESGNRSLEPAIALAHALRQSCPRLQELVVNSEEFTLTDVSVLLSCSIVRLTEMSPLLSIHPRILPLRTIRLHSISPCPLGIIWDCADVLSDTLEHLEVCGRKSSFSALMQYGHAMSILRTFRRLRTVILPRTIVHATELFEQEPEGGDEEHMERGQTARVKSWACQDLTFLQVKIESPDSSWWPSSALLEKDDYLREEKTPSSYIHYTSFKRYLDSFPDLDQSQIRYIYR